MEAAFPFQREDLPAHVLCVSRLSSLELPLGGGSAGLEHRPHGLFLQWSTQETLQTREESALRTQQSEGGRCLTARCR